MSRISLAFRSFFAILFGDGLPAVVAAAYGYVKEGPKAPPKPAAPAPPPAKASDGALQMLGILQRDARLIDFLMEDISGYSDDQVGAAVRNLHEQCRKSLDTYVHLAPVIDGVEGAYAKLEGSGPQGPSAVKLIGNVPADGKAKGGTLRHRGWRADKVDLPALPAKADPTYVAPAEIEIE
jgi:Domain of unknown function (DUF2760)